VPADSQPEQQLLPQAVSSDGEADAGMQAGVGSQETASGAVGKPSLVQRVIRQVSKLSISGAAAGAAGERAAPFAAGLTSTPGATDDSGGLAGISSAVSGAASAAPLATAAQAPNREGAEADGSAGIAQPELQRGLLDSLSLVHDLSQVRAAAGRFFCSDLRQCS
jgi:hypothetical protein